jgi:hypothetical protein
VIKSVKMTELGLLSEVNRWVGVTIALVGSVVVAPDGTRLLWSSSWARLRHQGFRAQVWLARKLPFLAPYVLRNLRFASSIVMGAGGEGINFPRSVAVADERPWPTAASVGARIEALRQYVAEIEERLDDAVRWLGDEARVRTVAIRELDRKLADATADLRRLAETRDRQAAVVDARGLPVIGLGIVLSGVPEALAALPWHLGWAMPVLGACSAIVAVFHTIRQHVRRTRSNHSPDAPEVQVEEVE